jgi:ferredoxin
MSRTLFVCSCEDTMAPDAAAIAKGTGCEVRGAEQLCRAQLDRFLAAMGEGKAVTVACTQEAPLFRQEAEQARFAAPLAFANIREHAGWSREGAKASPKMAAILAGAAVPMPETALVPLESKGVTLLLGRDAAALEVARRLAEALDLTVLLTGEEEVAPPPSLKGDGATGFPVLRGRARTATGWLGAFAITVDGFAAPAPASRDAYKWGAPRDGAKSQADLILDLSGHAALFPTHELRQGYLRAHPTDRAAVERLIGEARQLVGQFDKPRFVSLDEGLCAHSRNRKTGCTRCLDLCPTGAITPSGKDHVAVSAEICAGCGACAAVCPTGAITYALPPPDALARRLRAMLVAHHAAGGRDPVILFHDGEHGEALLDAAARHGEGLPAHVIPLRANEVSQLDLSLLAGAMAWGAAGVRALLPSKRPHGAEGVLRNLGYLAAALEGFSLSGERAAAIETDDPFAMLEALAPTRALRTTWQPDGFLPMGAPREVLRQALRALHAATGAASPVIAMPEKAPFGLARVATEGCTLCLACTMVCPTSALTANPDSPELRFLEDACVQCGLCAATCPEKVITLEPRLNLAPEASQIRTVKAEEPLGCARCQKPFGTRSSVERVRAKLQASGHWMFRDPQRLSVLELCEDCRVVEATTGGLDPYAGPERPATKTSEDWLREAERAKREGG